MGFDFFDSVLLNIGTKRILKMLKLVGTSCPCTEDLNSQEGRSARFLLNIVAKCKMSFAQKPITVVLLEQRLSHSEPIFSTNQNKKVETLNTSIQKTDKFIFAE